MGLPGRRGRAALAASLALVGLGGGALAAPGSPGTTADARAVSQPRVDPVYPGTGDDVVDALHYDLRLSWLRPTRTLVGRERLTFRAARDADVLRLDLSRRLRVSALRLDDVAVPFRQHGDDLVVRAPLTADSVHRLDLAYRGRPAPVRAPSVRDDLRSVGLTTSRGGQAWTFQQPYGAFTWYAVDDQPADKATYDVRVATPPAWRGVSGGRLVAERRLPTRRVMRWRLDVPAAAYTTTLAVGPYERRGVRGAGDGPRIVLTLPTGRADRLERRLRHLGADLAWLGRRLGPYPFDSLGVLGVPGASALEAQSLVTIGVGRRAPRSLTSRPVLVHELAHQWCGDLLTPSTWRDVWLSEGLATYLQALYEAQHGGPGIDDVTTYWHYEEPRLRADAGPPAAYPAERFGDDNVYVIPALMWHRIRQQVGDAAFWAALRAWPTSQPGGVADLDGAAAWWSEATGHDLVPVFERWLRGTDPADAQASSGPVDGGAG
ncbi:hypothetical protein K8Z61_14535 [Nocardioides sp. TRM66260-LWL]|uniref:M1 family aminopeptidase n=1 Tax=Nocardioides sp. TRM66260-LWL TaxID=2874478 RepID=UPI001CC4B4FE|nr:M1 family aminopeptidase [Nocardioides sp. TRM66260-LWL]MBZ5735708.1 hypothetical protein [Nocardioides sp. TRM66260-LWL]